MKKIPKGFITHREAAKESHISINLLYYYIKKDIIPRPEHIYNRGGNVLAIYPTEIINIIKHIKKRTSKGEKLNDIKQKLPLRGLLRKQIMYHLDKCRMLTGKIWSLTP